MDSEYLKQNVGAVLADGLAAVVLNNPPDQVDYLARWLLKYVDTVEREQQVCMLVPLLCYAMFSFTPAMDHVRGVPLYALPSHE